MSAVDLADPMAEATLVSDQVLAAGAGAVVIDPDRNAAFLLRATLKRLGFQVCLASGWPTASTNLTRAPIEWIFCEAGKLPPLDVIHEMLCTHPSRRVVALVQGGRVDRLNHALLALEQGAHDFLIKPAQIETVAGIVLALRGR